jgi:hypothetical protein
VSLLSHALDSVGDLEDAVGWLQHTLMPGTARPWRTPTLTPEQRNERDRLAKLERAERGHVALREAPEPYSMDTAELLTDILVCVDTIAEMVTAQVEADLIAWAGPWAKSVPTMHQPASSHMADPRPYLTLLREVLPEVQDERPDLLTELIYQADIFKRRADQVVGHISDGYTVAVCPFCQGRTERAPAGGEKTLRYRLREAGNPLIVCENPLCEPDSQHFGVRFKGRPAWLLMSEGDWLARCIEAVEEQRLCRCGNPLPLTGQRGRPATYCSETCRQDARRVA